MKLVILDRDGVINYDSEDYIKSPAEWHPIPGSLEAIAQLNALGYTVVVATNQSGLARGYYDEPTLTQIHDKMHRCLKDVGGKIDGVFYCPHGPQDGCLCRKPRPGLLQQIAHAYQTPLSHIPMVGDSLRDIEAAQNAGATPILVLSGNGQKTRQTHAQKLAGVACYESLHSYVRSLLQEVSR